MNNNCAIITSQKPPQYSKTVTDRLFSEGIDADVFSWDNLDFDSVINIDNYSTIIITEANKCPAFLPNAISEYLKHGGNVVTLGGPAFASEFYNKNNKETDIDELALHMQRGGFDQKMIIPFDCEEDLQGFEKDTYNPDSKKYEGDASLSIVYDEVIASNCMKYHTDNFIINESFEKEISIGKGHNVLGFYAKADHNTKTITIVLIQKNGDMFKTRITPTTTFIYFMLSKKDFVFAGNRSGITYEIPPQYVNFNEAEKIQFGHALSHAYSVAGKHSFYIHELSSDHMSLLNDEKISIDGLCPEYKFYPVTNAVKLKTYGKQAFLSEQEFIVPKDLFSLSPRAQATGIDKQRRFRFVPLIEAFDEKNLHCGYGAYMLLNISTGERKSQHNKSTIIAFTTNDVDFYENGGAESVAQAIKSLYQSVVLVEGGANEYIYMPDDTICVLGAVVLVRDSKKAEGYSVKISAGNSSRTYDMDELCSLENDDDLDLRLIGYDDTPQDATVTVKLVKDGEVCDILTHEMLVYKQKPEKERKFAFIKKGENEIYIGDNPARFFGVNYMPTSSAGMETGEEFEHYVAGFAFDPDIVEIDLKRIRDLGLNSVSIFMHYNPSINSSNILYLVELCRKYGLYVDLAIRPNANPFNFNKKEVYEMITKYRFQDNDNIVSFDIAWERYVGTYEPCYGNFEGRKSFDDGWRKYITNRYGSVQNAEKAWGFNAPRNADGEIIGVSDDMLRQDGQHNTMVACYRRFIDDEVALKHIKAMQYIKEIAPHHLISPRTGDASTIPLVDPGIYGYDYKALSMSMDFMSPESYALTDDYENMRQGIFTNIYSRYANPNNVVEWKEFGKSIWIGSNFIDNKISEQFQANYYRQFFDMLIKGHTAGLYAWWWAGGYRIGENSDFGIIAPDGSDRLATKVFREYATKFINAPKLKQPTRKIHIDRDLHADGLLSMYKGIEKDLFSAVEKGETVMFYDGGSKTTSVDVSLTEVGNFNFSGYVPKHLSGIITNVKVYLPDNAGREVVNGDTIKTGENNLITIKITAVNSEKSIWIDGDNFGSVRLVSTKNSDYDICEKLICDINPLEFANFLITLDCTKKGKLEFVLNAKDRANFGEIISLNII